MMVTGAGDVNFARLLSYPSKRKRKHSDRDIKLYSGKTLTIGRLDHLHAWNLIDKRISRAQVELQSSDDGTCSCLVTSLSNHVKV